MVDQTVTESGPVLSTPGALRPEVTGVVVVFQRGPCTPVPHRIVSPQVLGRSETADVTLADASVSREHALLEPAPGGVLVTDLGSHNGTTISTVAVTAAKTLAPFDSTIRLAKTLLLVTRDALLYEQAVENVDSRLVGGAALNDVRLQIRTFGPAPTAVLIEGQTGTGKEVVAGLLHASSGRPGPFVAVNCAALAPELVESELFGHAKGAFSGSVAARAGLFREADGGTLFLDELAELPLPMQAKLLRVLETGEVRGVGQDAPTQVDVRIVAATNQKLDERVVSGAFRGDLLHRIAGARIRLPALTDRRADIVALCHHFNAAHEVHVSVGAMDALLTRSWPGNVRELKNVLFAAAATAKARGQSEIRLEDLGEPAPPSRQDEREEERQIREALAQTDGNVTRAAKELGLGRSSLYEAIRRLGLDPAAFRKR